MKVRNNLNQSFLIDAWMVSRYRDIMYYYSIVYHVVHVLHKFTPNRAKLHSFLDKLRNIF